jgi:predicted transcriptional regulator of viral defense system
MFKSMSGLEQRLYFRLGEKDQRVFTIQDIKKLLNISISHARNIASDMVKKNVAERAKSGLFVRIPESVILDKQQYTEDAILIAVKSTNKAFLSHYTALTIHGLAERYTNQIYNTTTKHQRNIKYHEIKINYIKTIPKKFFGYKTMTYSNERIKISDLERTIIDVINKPKYAGGWNETINCLKNFDKINYIKLIGYLKKFNNKTITRKTGYILEKLNNLNPSQKTIEEIKELSGSNNLYFDTTKKGIYDQKWNLIIPENIIEAINAY